jgi:hypothetical protein
MNARALLLLLFLIVSSTTARGQDAWTTAAPLTPGDYDDTDPVCITRPPSFSGITTEWIAFSRQNPGETWRNIHVLSSDGPGLTWPGPAVAVTHDAFPGADNIRPSLAGIPSAGMPGEEELMLVWEYHLFESSFIFWSRRVDTSWLPAQAIGTAGGSNHAPCVAPVESTFIMVWERNGRVMFSDFRSGTWDSEDCISAPGDSMCSNPVVCPLGYPSETGGPIVVWESRKPASTDHALWFSYLTDTGWSLPDTLTAERDNRNPQFVRRGWPGVFEVSWESNRTGDWEVFGAGGTMFGGAPSWEDRDIDLTNTPFAEERHAAFQLVPIPVGGAGENYLYHTASAWVMSTSESDSIALRVFGDPATSYQTGGLGSTDRNPDISSGLQVQGWMRTWVVWESNASGRWNLYASRADFSVDVDEAQESTPGRFALLQNYPNPFNPATTIEFRIQNSEFTILKVYDVLGRELSTLVNEPKEPGVHTVRWDASGVASGVYFCRLSAGGLVQARKLIVTR